MLHERPLWRADYKSMSVEQLVRALGQLAAFPHHYDNIIERRGVIGAELAIRASNIIVAEPVPEREKTMALQIIDGPLFQPGESLSEGIDISGGNIVRITCPGQWSPANLTFQISSDGASGYNDLYDASGNEITIVVRGDNSAIIVRDPWSATVNWIKFRSGTAEHPVPQANGALFAVAIEVPDEAPAA